MPPHMLICPPIYIGGAKYRQVGTDTFAPRCIKLDLYIGADTCNFDDVNAHPLALVTALVPTAS